MLAKLLRAKSGKHRPTVATAVGNSTKLDISRYAWGAIQFSVDPGTVTVYGRTDEDDSWGIARTKNGVANITFTPGASQPYPLPDDIFYYNEIALVASNNISATSNHCRVSFKS